MIEEVRVVKLAEALILRADYQKRIAQIQPRLIRSTRVQEGEEPLGRTRSIGLTAVNTIQLQTFTRRSYRLL